MRQAAEVADPVDEPYRLLKLLTAPSRRVRRRVPLRWRRRLAVVVGGMAGGAARMGMSAVFDDGGVLPWGTLVANLTGALLLGYLLTRFLQAAPRTTLTIPLLCTGFLGSFTTFSTFSVETVQLVQQGRAGLAAAYAGGSVVFGLAAAASGIALAERRT